LKINAPFRDGVKVDFQKIDIMDRH